MAEEYFDTILVDTWFDMTTGGEGGRQIAEEVEKYTGADAYGKDAVAGVALAKQWSNVK